MMGSAARCSRCQNIGTSTANTITSGKTCQLKTLAMTALVSTWLMPMTRAVMPTTSMMVPARSKGLRACGRSLGSSRYAPIISSAAMGRFTRNSHCHEKRKKTPPSIGPIRKAMPHTEPSRPSAGPRCCMGSRAAITALATGKIPPAPKPWIERPVYKV